MTNDLFYIMASHNQIHPSAKVMTGVILNGDITIGENTYVASGVVINSNGGRIVIGSNTVIMESAIIRASSKFNCHIGDNIMIGPKACITGAIIRDGCFIATNATIFHGSELLSGTVVAVNGIVHIASHCPSNTFVPINHIAFGNPVKVYSPSEIPAFHAALKEVGFAKFVYDIDTTGLPNEEIYRQMTEKFLASLAINSHVEGGF